jgi:hypothetical protein
LSDASGDHVHQDLLIRNNFGRGLNEMCFHNLGNVRITLTWTKFRTGVESDRVSGNRSRETCQQHRP